MTNVRPVHTKPTDMGAASNAVHEFLTRAELDGTNLRMEYAKALSGQRLTLFFNYEDMG